MDAHPAPHVGSADLLTVATVADELRVSTTTVNRLIRSGALRAYGLGAQYRVTRGDLDAYLRGARTGGPHPEGPT